MNGRLSKIRSVHKYMLYPGGFILIESVAQKLFNLRQIIFLAAIFLSKRDWSSPFQPFQNGPFVSPKGLFAHC